MFDAVIHKNVKLAESPSHGKPISAYDRNSRGCKDYVALAREVAAQESAGSAGGTGNVGRPMSGRRVQSGEVDEDA